MIVNKESPFTFGNENDTTEVGTSVLTLKFSTPGTKDEIKVGNSSKPMAIKMKGMNKVETSFIDVIDHDKVHNLMIV